jgi:rubredoxin
MLSVADYAARRDYLVRRTPRCPRCEAAPCQMVNAHETPALWRCRLCRWVFRFEPPPRAQ